MLADLTPAERATFACLLTEAAAVPQPRGTHSTSVGDARCVRSGTPAKPRRLSGQILDRFPDAQRIEVPSHQNIPGLYGNEGNVRDWVRNKRNVHPITAFVNIEQILGYLERHAGRQGTKTEPNQCDPADWVYDIGENGDCSVDALVSDNVRDLVDLFGRPPNAKASFATKFVNRDLLTYDPRGGTRIRFSLMPEGTSRLVDLRTTPIPERIAAVNDFVAAGYEVHLNFSPVIVQEGWLEDWATLLDQIDAALTDAAKRQLACEVIFLTHNAGLHDVNLGWHPRAEELLWRPELQERKRSQSGQWNVRYRSGAKRQYAAQLTELLAATMPYCRVRYAF